MGLFSGKSSWKDEYDQRVNDPNVWDPTTGMVARKTCLDCDATLALSDPDLCALCDQARTARQSF